MAALEMLDRGNWEPFVASPVAMLMLAKADCENCAAWTEELQRFLETDREFGAVRFGKLYLDQGGLLGFKKRNPWLAEVDALPMNVIFRNGERVKTWAGGGVDRMANRLRGVLAGGE